MSRKTALVNLMAELGDALDKTAEDMERIEERLRALHDILQHLIDELTASASL